MTDKVVPLSTKESRIARLPVNDFWFAQVDVRLGRVERMLTRVEWQIWVIVFASAGLMAFEILAVLAPAAE